MSKILIIGWTGGRMLAIAMLASGYVVPACAQEAAQGDPSQGTGPIPPNVAPNPTPICTDRPTKATTACTVPAGDFQLETDLINWTRQTSDGTRTDTILYTNPTLKYGAGKHTDLEINLVPYETLRTRSPDGTVETDGGIGDLYLRIKQKLTADKSKTQVYLVGFVKAPTAGSVLGNGQWEGGAVVPVNIPLPYKFTLTTSPELDLSADQIGEGHHAELVNLVNLAHPVGKNATAYVEFWTKDSVEPARNTQQYSADLAASYQLTKTLQLDAAVYLGLNRETPGVQLYRCVDPVLRPFPPTPTAALPIAARAFRRHLVNVRRGCSTVTEDITSSPSIVEPKLAIGPGDGGL